MAAEKQPVRRKDPNPRRTFTVEQQLRAKLGDDAYKRLVRKLKGGRR